MHPTQHPVSLLYRDLLIESAYSDGSSFVEGKLVGLRSALIALDLPVPTLKEAQDGDWLERRQAS